MRRGITPQPKHNFGLLHFRIISVQILSLSRHIDCIFTRAVTVAPIKLVFCLRIRPLLGKTMSDRRNLGPLTNTFTPPSSCTINVIASDTGSAWQGQECTDDTVFDAATCWPTATVPAPIPPFEGWGFYSPGLVCPDGYTSACTASFNPSQSPSFQFALSSSETAVGCCPT